MGVYTRPNSPYFWLRLPRAGQPPLREATRIPIAGGPEARALAEAAFYARMGDLARGEYRLPGAPALAAPSLSFADWADWYGTHVIPTHRGQEREHEILDTLRAAFGHLALVDITREIVQEWMTARVSPEVSAATVNRQIDMLKAMLRSAADHKRIPASPLVGMKRLTRARAKRRLITPAEEARLLPCLGPVDRAIYLIAADSLVRLGDILDLRWTDVRGGQVYIADPKDPQQSEPYSVPLSARARAALKLLPREGAYLFPSRRVAATERDRRHTIAQALARACQRAGLPYGRAAGGLTFHWATRRTGATRLIQSGVDLSTVQQLGHWASADVVLEIYSEGSTSAAKRAVEIGGRLVTAANSKRTLPPALAAQPTAHRWTSEEARAAAAKRKVKRAWTPETAPRAGRPRTRTAGTQS